MAAFLHSPMQKKGSDLLVTYREILYILEHC